MDVEEKQRTTKHNILTLARRYFTKHELEVLTAIGDPYIQHQEFIKLWTLKVSLLLGLDNCFKFVIYMVTVESCLIIDSIITIICNKTAQEI